MGRINKWKVFSFIIAEMSMISEQFREIAGMRLFGIKIEGSFVLHEQLWEGNLQFSARSAGENAALRPAGADVL